MVDPDRQLHRHLHAARRHDRERGAAVDSARAAGELLRPAEVIDGYALTLAGALLAAGSLAFPETGFPQTLEAVAHVPGAGWRTAHSGDDRAVLVPLGLA